MSNSNDTTTAVRFRRSRIARAATAATLAAALLLQGGWRHAVGDPDRRASGVTAVPRTAGTPDGRMDATARLREAVEREAERLRKSLDAAEHAQDFAGLVRRKLTVDATLVPLHLVRDAIEFVRGPDDGDLLRSLRAEWRNGEPTSRWSHAGAAGRARRSLAEALRVGPDGTLRLRARIALAAWSGTEAPPAVDWEIEGSMTDAGPVVDARCVRVLPAFDAEHVGFPLPSTGFGLRWDQRGAAYADDDGTRHDERWRPDACFDNPVDLYAVFDGLRLARSPDRRCRAAATAADEVPSLPIGSVRSVDRADGTELRRERWNWDGDALRSIEWSQPELSVLHRSPQSAVIVTEAGGEVLSRAEHRPESAMRVPPIEAELRWTGPGEASFTMLVDGEAWAVGSILSVGPQSGAAGGARPALGVREVDAVLRQAMHSGDAGEVQRAVDGIEALHESAEAPVAQRSAERELLARGLLRHGHAELARTLLVGRWMRDLRAGEAEAAIARWCAAGEPEFAAAMADASGRPAGAGSGDDQAGPCPRDAVDAGREAPACDTDRLPPDCARFARCLVGAANAAAPRWLDARRLGSALCAACDRGDLPALEEGAFESLAADAQAAMAAGVGADAEAGLGSEARFVEQAVEAAARPSRPDAVLAAMRRSWRVIESEASATLRSLDASEAVADLRRQLRRTEGLLGNRFTPDFDAGTAAEPPTTGSVRAALEQRIGTAIESERRRARTADAILDPTLAEARRDSMPGRVAQAAAAAAVDEYLRWAVGTRDPRNG